MRKFLNGLLVSCVLASALYTSSAQAGVFFIARSIGPGPAVWTIMGIPATVAACVVMDECPKYWALIALDASGGSLPQIESRLTEMYGLAGDEAGRVADLIHNQALATKAQADSSRAHSEPIEVRVAKSDLTQALSVKTIRSPIFSKLVADLAR